MPPPPPDGAPPPDDEGGGGPPPPPPPDEDEAPPPPPPPEEEEVKKIEPRMGRLKIVLLECRDIGMFQIAKSVEISVFWITTFTYTSCVFVVVILLYSSFLF